MIVTAFSELSIDGRMTVTAGGSSKAMFEHYGPELGRWFHAQRAAHDAIMVGAGTVRADDPELTVRHVAGRDPVRVVPTRDGAIPAQSTILTDGRPTWFGVPDDLPAEARRGLLAHPGIELLDCGPGGVDLHRLLARLEERGIGSLMVEGGSRLLAGLFAAGLINRIVIKHIPIITGATDAATYLARDGAAPPVPFSRWRVAEWVMIGGVGVSIYERGETA